MSHTALTNQAVNEPSRELVNGDGRMRELVRHVGFANFTTLQGKKPKETINQFKTKSLNTKQQYLLVH